MPIPSPILLFGAVVLEVAVLFWLSTMLVSGFVSSIHGAPYVPIRRSYVQRLLALGQLGPADVVYDLGCGDGRILFSAVWDFHAARAVGYDLAPWPYRKCAWLVRRSGLKNIEIHNENFFAADLGEATCVYAYLLTKLIDRLAPKLAKELKPGTRVICPSFPIDTERHPQFALKKEEKIGTITAYLYERV